VTAPTNAPSPSGTCVHHFDPTRPDNRTAPLEVLGGKGCNLCELSKAGFPVPPGFVVTTAAYDHFLEANGLREKVIAAASKVDPAHADGLEACSLEIRKLFAGCEVPEELAREICTAYSRMGAAADHSVAVRSSATAEDLPEASFAGQQDTYLNVRGEEALLKAVRSCWSSLWTARAISYRAQQNIPNDQVALAAVIQRMVLSEASGVMFTANPITGARNEILINASWGLGESIVGGHVTPDSLVIDKASGKVKEVTVSEKAVMTLATHQGTVEKEITDESRHARVLDDAKAAELAAIGKKIEEHYQSPQDIEWCLAGGKFYIVQARPITALPVSPEEVEAARRDEIGWVKKYAEAHGKSQWAIYNLAETLKSPTPLTWDIVGGFMGGSGGFIRMYRDLGYFPSDRVGREGVLDLIGGRIYAHLERHAELFFDQWPLEYDPAAATDMTTMIEAPPTKFNFERAGMDFLRRMPVYIVKMIRQGRRMKKLSRRYLDEFVNEVVPKFMEYAKAVRAKDLSRMTEAELLAELDAREAAFNEIGREAEKTSSIAGYFHGSLSGTLEQAMGIKAGQELVSRLIGGLDNDRSMQQSIDLYRVAQGDMPMEKFIEEYGHRTVGEFELSEPRWSEDPGYIRQQAETYRGLKGKSPEESHRHQKEQRLLAEKQLGQALAENGASSLEEDVRRDLAGAQRYLPYRETSKYYYMMALALVRWNLEELARRWNLGGDIYFLRRKELAEFPARREELKAEIAKRKVRWEALQRLEVPELISSDDPEAIGRPEELAAGKDGVFAGKGLAAGSEVGIARIVHSPKNAGDLGPNYILVCTSTDPGWTPLFVNARGVIVERGGMLSHGAIVARDFGIPCVALHNATKLIPNGAEIRVDGNRGQVELIGAAAAAAAKEA
jgi:phosphohistidine swiveling domain-containing protein